MTIYDEVLYPTHTFPQTHPDRLATIAALLGMHPAKVENCRYLELGCGSAGNLVPMAYNLPDSEFVGIDLAGGPIAAGRKFADELGLKNLKLHHMSVEGITEEFGKFDYIVVHGVYSWVSSQVRDKIMEICKTNLAEQGVAYISYNTLPGGHLRRMVREMMLYHVQHFEDPQQKIDQARGLLTLLSAADSDDSAYVAFMKKEVENVQEYSPAHLFHDDLAEINDPVYFHKFVEHANQFGMKFLAEADFFDMSPDGFPKPVAAKLKELGDDVLRREQYADFLRCRRFRQSLICHESTPTKLHCDAVVVSDLFLASTLRPAVREGDSTPRELVEFHGEKGGRVSTDHPLLKEAFGYLGENWPQMFHFDELFSEARSRSGRTSEDRADDAKVLAHAMLESFESNVLKLHSYRPKYVTVVSDNPRASELTLAQIKQDIVATNHLHTSLKIEDPLARAVLRLLDGSRNRNALQSELTLVIENSKIKKKDKLANLEKPPVDDDFGAHLDECLGWFAKNGMLVA